MKKIDIFLDDERNPEDVTWVTYPDNIEWVIVRDMSHFISLVILYEDIKYISFDHDLQDFNHEGKESTGYDCLKWLLNYCDRAGKALPDLCFFHTQNTVGKENMKAYYENYVQFKLVSKAVNL